MNLFGRTFRRLAVGALAISAAAVVVWADPPQTPQSPPAGRGAIQSAGGGRGPGAAPEADNPLNASADLSPKPPVLAATPEEQAKRFWLPAGYKLEPILSDPVIEDPAYITFDGNGRMFVIELRGYFETPEGIDLIPPIGRISRHEDRDNDGVYETHTVFVDKLVFPRFATPLGADTILTIETNTDDVWKYTDTNGDGVADRKELFSTNFGRAGTMESQPSSLFWAMDNWMYSTVNAFRIRWMPVASERGGASGPRAASEVGGVHGVPAIQGSVVREPTGPNGAQWGVTQDDDGKVWFQHGASGLPGYFQFPVHYGNFATPDQFEPDLNIVWGAPILIGDIQAGLPGTRMPDGSLIYGTAAAGNEIYRGHRLPKDLLGDYLHGDMVARIVRRLRPVKSEGLTQLRNVYPRSEFIRSLDPLFRPAHNTTAPDGTIYIADMYRGIIEGAEWAKEGTYLRQKIKQYQLDKVMHHGRVWRLTYEGTARDRTMPRMLNETPAQLVAHLSHPNGWWRDTAQQLLVLKQDKSVVPALLTIVKSSQNRLARFHALWTIEGLGALTAPLVRDLLRDPDPRIRIQVIRASETLYKAGDRSLAADYRPLTQDKDVDVAIQAILTTNTLKAPDASVTIKAAMNANKARGVQFVADRILNPPAGAGRGGGRGGAGVTPEQLQSLERGETIYNEICFSCHGDDGRGTPTPGGGGATLAPSLAGSSRVIGHRDYVVKALLHGLAGAIDGRTYPQVMVPLGSNKDQWVADVASFVRNAFGNAGGFVTTQDVIRVRADTPNRNTPWTADELVASLPRPLAPAASWKVTASHQAQVAPQPNPQGGYSYQSDTGGLLTFQGWNSGASQVPGMWVQIEMPAAVQVTEMQFTAAQLPAGRAGQPAVWTFPRGYRLQVSTDGTTWSAPIAEGAGLPGVTTITFAPVTARFVRLTTTAADPAPWSMRLLRLYERGRAFARPSPGAG